jgi:hypothetical protein
MRFKVQTAVKIHTVTYRPIVRQKVGKHIPAKHTGSIIKGYPFPGVFRGVRAEELKEGTVRR